MAFICKACLPQASKWLADLRMGVSRGPCESCGTVKFCVDFHGSMTDDAKPLGEPLDTYRYDEKE